MLLLNCKGTANRENNQVYLRFSEVSGIFRLQVKTKVARQMPNEVKFQRMNAENLLVYFMLRVAFQHETSHVAMSTLCCRFCMGTVI